MRPCLRPSCRQRLSPLFLYLSQTVGRSEMDGGDIFFPAATSRHSFIRNRTLSIYKEGVATMARGKIVIRPQLRSVFSGPAKFMALQP